MTSWPHSMTHIVIWRHISSHVSFIEKCPVLIIFRIKFTNELPINKLASMILKILKNGNFHGGSKSKRTKKQLFRSKKFGLLYVLEGATFWGGECIPKSSFIPPKVLKGYFPPFSARICLHVWHLFRSAAKFYRIW